MKSVPTLGQRVTLAYTHPYYDRQERKYLPDGFRFTDPDIVRGLIYTGGRQYVGIERRCSVCGRSSSNCHEFMSEDGSDFVWISQHCLRHDSTTSWNPDVADGDILRWYEHENLVRSAESGDSIARLAMAFEDLEGRDVV